MGWKEEQFQTAKVVQDTDTIPLIATVMFNELLDFSNYTG